VPNFSPTTKFVPVLRSLSCMAVVSPSMVTSTMLTLAVSIITKLSRLASRAVLKTGDDKLADPSNPDFEQ